MRAVVCGNVVFDILARPVDELRWETTTVVDQISRQLGGNAASTSRTLAILGIPVTIVTLVGRDPTGETVVGQLRESGVDTGCVQYVDAPTSTAISLIRHTGERALLYELGAASEEFAPFSLPADATHFHLAAVYRMKHLRRIGPDLLRHAREAGLTTSLDTQWDTEGEWMKVLAPSLPYTDYALMNAEEARLLTGETAPERAAAILRDRGAKNVVIKRGANGCWVNGTAFPGFPVAAVDTTGAGDCFSGAFVAALQRGFSTGESARFANGVAAMAVQAVGATAGVRGWNESVQWITKAVSLL